MSNKDMPAYTMVAPKWRSPTSNAITYDFEVVRRGIAWGHKWMPCNEQAERISKMHSEAALAELENTP